MPVADGAQQRVELGAFAVVEAGRRLVEAEQHRLGAHRARDFEPALRAIGQRAGGVVGAIDKADPVEPVTRPLDCLRLGARDSVRDPNRPSTVKPEATISVLCCATRRFSSSVMPANSRTF